ncbi:MAG: TonB-dependent receptor [Betaproteobacteria bacterium]
MAHPHIARKGLPALSVLTRKFRFSALALAVASASGVMAQTAPAAPAAAPPPAPADAKTLKQVTVTEKADEAQGKDSLQTTKTSVGKGTQEIRDIPQSISVITEKLLDDRKIDTLKQALHHTAGISFAATENGTDQDIRLRGFPIASTGDLFVDGMRDPSQYDRDVFNYDRIEVMRGSASMLFGRGSTGGIVNQVTKKPLLADQNELVGTAGSRRYYRGTGDFNMRTGENSAARLNVMINKADNGGARIDKSGIAPGFSWGIDTPDEFFVGLFYLKVDNVPFPPLRWLNGTIPQVKPGDFYGLASDTLLGEALQGTAQYTHRFGDGGQLKTSIRNGKFDRTQWSTAGGFATGTTAANLNSNTVVTRGGLTPRQDVYHNTYAQSDYSNNYNWFGYKHDVLTGIDVANEKADRDAATNTPVAAARPTTTVGGANDGIGIANTIFWRPGSAYKAQSFGTYAQDLIQIAEHWKVLAGIRWDSFNGDFKQFVYSANTPAGVLTSVNNTHLGESLFSKRAGLLYQPSAMASFHFSYSTSFNTSADTYQFVSQQTANTPPEKSRNIELGAKLDWMDGALSTRMALYHTEKYNERNNDQDTASNAFLLSGKRHTRGVEFDIVGHVAKGLEVYLSYSLIPTAAIDKVGSTGNASQIGPRVGLTPRHSGSIWASYEITSALRIAGGVNGASRTYPLTVAGANSAPGYAVADAMIEYKINPDLMAQVNVSNIGNRLYGDQLYPAFAVSGAPRTYLFTLAKRF